MLKAPLLKYSIMTRKDQEDRRSHLLEKYKRIQRKKKGLSKKGQRFRVLKKTKPEAKAETKRPAPLPAAVDTTFVSVMKPAAKWS